MRQVGDVLFLALLTVGAFLDVRARRVPVWYLAVMTVLLFFCRSVWGGGSAGLWISGAAVGGGFLLLSRCTGEGIGYGDSWMILNLGLFLGIWRLLAALMTAFFLAAAVACAGVRCRRWGRKERIPFFPFLLIGYVGVLLW